MTRRIFHIDVSLGTDIEDMHNCWGDMDVWPKLRDGLTKLEVGASLEWYDFTIERTA